MVLPDETGEEKNARVESASNLNPNVIRSNSSYPVTSDNNRFSSEFSSELNSEQNNNMENRSISDSYDEGRYNVYDHLSTSSYRVERVNTPKTSSGTSCIRKMMSVLSCLIAIISLVFGIKTRLFPDTNSSFLCETTQLYRQLTEFNSIGFIRYNTPSHQVTISLTLEQLFRGYITEYDLEVNQRCPSCDGRGLLSSTCPVCKGRGVVDTVYGMGYCPQCQGHGHVYSKQCHVCHGTGHVLKKSTVHLDVQPGALDDASKTYSLSDRDEVIFTIHQKPHPTFVRKEKDLYMQLSISMKEALLGTQKQIKMIDGELVTVTIPAGIQHGKEIVVKNKGFIWDVNSKLKKTVSHFITVRGNLYIRVNIEFPSSLSADQRKVIESIF